MCGREPLGSAIGALQAPLPHPTASYLCRTRIERIITHQYMIFLHRVRPLPHESIVPTPIRLKGYSILCGAEAAV